MDREVAGEAFGILRERRFGHRLRLFDAKIVTMVAACVSTIDGTRETKMRAELDAIDHAFGVSRGTPRPSYIWGNIDHFLEHEAAGGALDWTASGRARVRSAPRRPSACVLVSARSRSVRRVVRPEVLQFMEGLRRGKW